TAEVAGAGGKQAPGNATGGAGIGGLLRNYIIDWFDLGRDIDPFYTLLKKDKRLAYMVEEYKGLRLIGIVDLFEALCWSVIGQQINLQFAYKTKRRLVERYGSRIEYGGKNYYLFPTPGQLAAATMEELKGMQFSQNKARYLIGLGEVFAKGDLSKEQLIAIDGLEERRKALTDLKGVGIWTANYSLMKSLRDPTCIPHGDVGLLNALAGHAIIKERSEEQKIEKLFSKFPGWESYLVFYLWRSLAGPGRAAPRSLAV
ncbi:MAG TPA: DNA glycosylase, partial [Puia sp.]|nr:DNA glycosylase [Puia sp.]